MAQMVLSSVGQYIGNAYGMGQFGAALGSIAGSMVDDALFPAHKAGARLSDLQLLSSTEGAAIPRIDGTIRLSGQVIWATKFHESKATHGGKSSAPSSVSYTYRISFAVGLCQGVAGSLGRIWADGTLIDPSVLSIRFYRGTEDQSADPLIVETEGADNSPAYRGLCYVVFEDMDVTPYGGRIPQLQFEVNRPLTALADQAALENILTGANLIPGAGEFVYATTLVVAEDDGTTLVQNGANACGSAVADVLASLDGLIAAAPQLQSVSLVVGWFGTDLRAGVCQIHPCVDTADKDTYGEYFDENAQKQTEYSWKVAGITRANATVVSYVDGFAAYGGTPADDSVRQILAELKKRGLKVTLYPFLFMDIPAGNTLANPYSDNGAGRGQPAYPWRGRISCHPAPGYCGSADKTSAAADQVEAFFSGPWGYNHFVLHYADLCAACGGVDSFLIGSELVGLTHVRSAPGDYPAVTALRRLAGAVHAKLGPACKVGYAADWSEWNNHQTGDAPGAVLFNLDPLWADSAIDFIGIDNYMPLSDWRDGTEHRDFLAGVKSPYNLAYLQKNICGGEYYDWYYACAADRDSQIRTAITDGGCGKPWVWRAKDLHSWWTNAHYDRPDGHEVTEPTGWIPQSKPIRFTELGCPAVDKGANQPNLFQDAKSSESGLPYYSSGARDDMIQRAFLQAQYLYWSDRACNPVSTVYGGAMLAQEYIAAWCWDARPYPAFPARRDLWADAVNYSCGDWLNGRLGAVLLSDLVAEICRDAGFTDYDVSGLCGLVTGYTRSQTMSAREELENLSAVFFFDACESDGKIRFFMRGGRPSVTLGPEALILDTAQDPGFGYQLSRMQDCDLPRSYQLRYCDAGNDYEQASYRATRLAGNSNRVTEQDIALVMDRAQAATIGDKLLQQAWAGRESVSLSLPPSQLALDCGDTLALSLPDGTRNLCIGRISDGSVRTVSATACDASVYDNGATVVATPTHVPVSQQSGRGIVVFMDIPLLADGDVGYAPYLAGYAAPWPGGLSVYRSIDGSSFFPDTTLQTAAVLGETLSDFYSGPLNRWDRVNTLYVRLYSDTLSSADSISVLCGANVLALQNGDGWEIMQFQTATLTGPGQWKLSGLLRGLLGSETQMVSVLGAGARVVVVNRKALFPCAISAAQYASPFLWRWGPADKDYASAAYQQASLCFHGTGLRPYAPCHLRYAWSEEGALTFFWIRRDRSPSADSWEPGEIVQSEAAEAYELDISDAAGTVLRTVRGLSVTSYLYPKAMQQADFGSSLSQGMVLILTVYQMSAVCGRGAGKRVVFYL